MNFTKVYERYVDSGLVWVGNYPELWRLTKVKYEASVKARVGWHGLKSDDFTEAGPYLVTGTDFKGKSINWSDCYHCDIERYEQDPYIQLRNGDLLLTKDGTIGKVALVENLKENDKATLNSGVFVVRPLSTSLATEFYFWLLQSTVFIDFVDYHKTGSTILHLYQDTFVNFIYATPSFIEQTRIVAFLNYEMARVDRLISLQRRMIELLKEKKQALISHAVTKGLNPDVSMKDSGIEWLGQVPEHWVVGRVKRLSKVSGGYAFNSTDFVDSGIQLIKIGNLYQSCLQLDRDPTYLPLTYKEKHSAFVIKNGDLLMSLTGTLGKRDYGFAVKYDADEVCLLNQRVAKFKPYTSKVDSDFLLFILLSDNFLTQIYSMPSGTKQANLSSSDVLSPWVFFPPSQDEQREVVEFINQETVKLDRVISRTESVIELIQERRIALISAAVTGKIDLRGWTPPAEEVAA